MYVCYMLKSDVSRHTYIGATLDPVRRIRQHNGEICGGAKYTRSYRPWTVHMVVSGFPNQRSALQFEWAWKHASRKATGSPIERRMDGLSALLGKERWTSNAQLSSTMPLQLAPKVEALFEQTNEMVARYDGVRLAEPPPILSAGHDDRSATRGATPFWIKAAAPAKATTTYNACAVSVDESAASARVL